MCPGYFRGCLLVLSLALLAGCAAQQITQLPEPDEQELIREAEAALAGNRPLVAVDQYQRALVINPDNAQSRLALAELLLQKRQFPVAASHYERLLEEAEVDARVYEGLGTAYLRMQRHGEARELLERAINTDPGRPLAHNYLGVLADLEGQHLRAMFHYEKARELDPRNPLVFNNMGYSLMVAGDYPRAEHMFREALAFSPDDAERIRNNLVILYARQGRFDEAVRVTSPAMDDPVAYNNVGYIALINGRGREAIPLFERALDLSPGHYRRAALNLERAKRESR